MPGWIGPAVAVSLIVIALTYAVLGIVVVVAAREGLEQTRELGRELAHLRADLAPTLDAVKRLGEQGAGVVELAQEEARQIVETTRRIRHDVERGVTRTKQHLADLEAVVEVAQDEIEAAVVDVGAALQTARTGAGMIGQLRRLVRPRRRGAA